MHRSRATGSIHKADQTALWLATALLLWLAMGVSASAFGDLTVTGRIEPDGSAVHLSWAGAKPPRVGAITVSRRELGETRHASWRPVSPMLRSVMSYDDRSVRPGVAYEYQVQRFDARKGTLVDSGYWTAGVNIPAPEVRGTALLVVDDEITDPLAPQLDRLALDLTGDGWQVLRHRTPRGIPGDPVATLARARELKAWISEQYDAAPETNFALILVGQVPLVRSGNVAPDGHDPEPHATDLFYAEMELDWPDDGNGRLTPSTIPSGDIEMMVGRIDFSSLSPNDPQADIVRIAAYLDKDHHWRNALLGDLRQAYGKTKHLAVEIAGLRNVVGDRNLVEGGHHDVGEQHPWLMGVDFGDWNGANYATDYANKAVFTINFGSGKQKIDRPNNAMVAMLAQPWYPLTVAWGARPAWRLHPLAFGAPVGVSQLRTANNGDPMLRPELTMEYLPTGQYLFRNPIWANLLGDPTLHAFPLSPVRRLSAEAVPEGVALSWTPPVASDVLGARIYRAGNAAGPFVAIDGGTPVAGTRFVDPAPVAGAVYMVRSYGRKVVNAGSFFTLSQGRFAEVARAPAKALDLTLQTSPGQPVRISGEILENTAGSGCFAIVAAPPEGRLQRDGASWIYTPRADFSGNVRIGYTLFDGLSGDTGTITITVGAG
ncbi:hypothetical protein [Tropicimonas sp. IMCC34043]|uniref:Ig-like domain-containing protein n=1 Tax=Tropicimonas sp. IMCC34043 TaxID=2248760 RepID=UPI000E27091B|nr:hypothetical protein [Tropicimonas sp. IMCC34043]